MNHAITITVGDRDFHPSDFSLQKLSLFLDGLGDSIESEYFVNLGSDDAKSNASVLASLQSITEGSCRLMISVGAQAHRAVGQIVRSLKLNDLSSLSLPTQEALTTTVNRVTKEHDLRFAFEFDGVVEEATIQRKVVLKVDRSQIVTGETQRTAVVISAGGLSHGGCVRLPSGENVRVSANKKHTEILGENLYKDVVIVGSASWRLPDWKMVKITAKSVAPASNQPTSEILTELAKNHRLAFPHGGLTAYLADREEDEGE